MADYSLIQKPDLGYRRVLERCSTTSPSWLLTGT